LFTKELVDDWQHLHFELLSLAYIFSEPFNYRAGHNAGDQRYAPRLRHGCWQSALAVVPLLDQEARHAHTVLNLRVRAIVLGWWELVSRYAVPLVREVDEWVAAGVSRGKAPLVALHLSID